MRWQLNRDSRIRNERMDYELEVFEVYDETEQPNRKHTRKKCKQKTEKRVLNSGHPSNSIYVEGSSNASSLSSVHSKTWNLRKSIFSLFSKLLGRNNRRYKSNVSEQNAQCSKDFRRGYIPCGKHFQIWLIWKLFKWHSINH